jgi:chlorite dismutase
VPPPFYRCASVADILNLLLRDLGYYGNKEFTLSKISFFSSKSDAQLKLESQRLELFAEAMARFLCTIAECGKISAAYAEARNASMKEKCESEIATLLEPFLPAKPAPAH